MPELLLIEAAPSDSDSDAGRLSQWAAALHDRLDTRRSATTADRLLVTSWLRVQAVGRETVTVVEQRADRYAALWAAAARPAGLATRVTTSAGASYEPTPDASLVGPAREAPLAADVDDRWHTRARSWLLDRAEYAGRIAIRAFQR